MSRRVGETEIVGRTTGTTAALVAVLGFVLLSVACGGRSTDATTWTACPRPAGEVDIRQFRVRGQESCDHAHRILRYATFGSEGGCRQGCKHEGYTCLEHLGRHTQQLSGLSLFTYVDDVCAHGSHEAAWRVVFH
jgi:hypothetical protein